MIDTRDLGPLVDIVEETTAYLKERGALKNDRAEFLTSRLIEFGMRGMPTTKALPLLGLNQSNRTWEMKKNGLAYPSFIMDLGAAVAISRQCLDHGINMTQAAEVYGIRGHLAPRFLGRCFGMRWPEIQGKTWQELVEIFLERRWPEWGAAA